MAITTNTAETARTINTEIQRRLDPAGRRPQVGLADGTQVSVGDQIATRRNHPHLRTDRGEQVRNRHTWTVTDLDPSGEIVASHPERGTVTLPADYVARHVELGWAVTGYGNQGDTVDIGLAVLEPGTTRNHAYVALTRGRTTNQAWIPDPTGTLDPADTLAGIITRTPDHDSALATHARLHREAGVPEPQVEIDLDTTGAARPEPQPQVEPPPSPEPSDPSLDDRVRAMQTRLDHLQQQRQPGRSLHR